MSDSSLTLVGKNIQAENSTGPGPAGCPAAGRAGSFGVQAPISCTPALVNAAIDTLSLSFKGSVPNGLINRLKMLKSEVQDTSEDCRFLPFGETKLFAWNLQRTGVKLFPFVLKSGDVSFYISGRDEHSSIPAMQLSVGSMSCQDNLSQLLKSFRLWCFHHGISIKDEIVSRIDICADLNVSIATLHLWNQAKMVTRAEKVACYYSNRKLTGVQVGSGDIVLRMYDKLQEMIDKQANNKMEFFKGIWGEHQNITRVEFQLRRAAIRDLFPEKSDFSTVSQSIPKVWKYLSSEWFRQTAKAVDRLNRNQSRETVSSFWADVQAAFDSFRHSAVKRSRRLKHINLKALVDQAAGIMVTVCAGLGHAYDDTFGILATAASLVQDRVMTSLADPVFERNFNSRVCRATVSF